MKKLEAIKAKDRERIMNYVGKGWSTVKMVSKFKGRLTKMQVAAIKAHITMGTYS